MEYRAVLVCLNGVLKKVSVNIDGNIVSFLTHPIYMGRLKYNGEEYPSYLIELKVLSTRCIKLDRVQIFIGNQFVVKNLSNSNFTAYKVTKWNLGYIKEEVEKAL